MKKKVNFGMDILKEFENRVTSYSTFGEIVAAFEAICHIPSNSEDDTIMYSAMRNMDTFDYFDEQPLFGSYDHFSRKTFCVEFSRDYEDDSPDKNFMLFSLTLGYPNELWNLGLLESRISDQSFDDFFDRIRATRTYRYLTTHDCKPDFVHVHFGKAE